MPSVEEAHPIARFGVRLHRALDEVADVAAWSMSPAELRETMLALSRAQARVGELALRVLAAADRADVSAESAASSTAAWLAHETRAHPSAARTDVRLALALDSPSFAIVREALAAGQVSVDQARVIVRSVEALPGEAAPWVREQAQKVLLVEARTLDPVALKLLGRRIFDVVDPDTADHAEGRRLEAEERAAARSTYVHLRDNGDGSHTLRAKLPTLHAAMLTKALHAFTAPAHRRDRPDPSATRPELLGQAFCELLERLPAERLPRLAGGSATVLVMLDFDKLVSGLGAAGLDTGHRISAGEARRLACTHGVIPLVHRRLVDGRSVVLDAGRRRRLHSTTQRIALTVQDQQCTADGCTRPAAWCHTHHDQRRWADGGHTSVTDGRLLCPHHHRAAHSPLYDMERLPTGQVRFHRRT